MSDQPPLQRLCIDLAYFEQGCLFVFGWMVEPGPPLVGVRLHVGARAIDLSRGLLRFARPDVAEHWPGVARGIDHGLLIAACPPGEIDASGCSLSLILADGTAWDATAELSRDRDRFAGFAEGHAGALERLFAMLDTQTADRLRAVAGVGGGAALAAPRIDLICLPVRNTLLVLGGDLDPAVETIGLQGVAAVARPLRFRREVAPGVVRQGASGDFVAIIDFDEAQGLAGDLVLVLAGGDRLRRQPLGVPAALDRGLAALERHLRTFDADSRLVVLGAMAAGIARWQVPPAIAARLATLRDLAVTELPSRLDRPDLGVRLTLDLVHPVGQEGVFLAGWAVLETDRVEQVNFRLADEPGTDILAHWVAHQRPDVWRSLKREGALLETDELGFICFIPQPIAPDRKQAAIAVRCRDHVSLHMRVDLPAAIADPVEAIKPILTSFHQTHRMLRRLLDRHIGPAVQAAWSSRKLAAAAPVIEDFGAPPADPEVSLVIPLYARFDFVEHQLAQFVDDAYLRRCEILYVVDDPAIYDECRLACLELSRFYEVPFRLVYNRCNAGFAAATNLGASLARGRYILMMNSDVLPDRPGWLAELVAAHRALPEAGAVAPKLLYEDGGIQHAGMRFMRLPLWGGLWVNDHPRKGQPNQAGTEPAEFMALTGACLLIRTALWREVGGLSEEYVIGDFEDSDLCLKLLRAGRRNWLVPAIELYHLERQSQDRIGDASWRRNLSLYNCWTHTQRWDGEISRRLEAS